MGRLAQTQHTRVGDAIGDLDEHDFNIGDVERAGQLVIVHCRINHQTDFWIEPALLEKRESNSHDDAAVDLAACGERIDDHTGIMNRSNFEHSNNSSFRIDFDLGELAARLVRAKALIVRNMFTVSGKRISGNSAAYVSER